ncbi:uncharacterized protein LOC100822996 [Brachypodium distachyon]|uniref:Uncharacterized protein n=1 Tax=Brachypodium distachyon TaxID=15368 RepID=I1H981_BRADI|nr:uncharacterized protein LOC100822996 [Brachypodium distachyon]KQK23412.1 hypothetical protein BRADI_1g73230v3 [Brachypodium distachyon]|eukprot:XP_003558713.1 uncharacterized protein LOC100822996 [Brachypodium distachyon]
MAGCCVFFLRWPSTSPARLGYHSLDDEATAAAAGPSSSSPVTVVVGKERREFAVEQLVLDTYPFRVLLETVPRKEERRGGKALFLDVDAILFEHILWLACQRSSVSLLHLDLREIIDFYSQDA